MPYVEAMRTKPLIDQTKVSEEEIKSMSEELRHYNVFSNNPPMEAQKRAVAIIERLMEEQGIANCETYRRPKYDQYIGDKERTERFLMDTWINGWDIRQSISELKDAGPAIKYVNVAVPSPSKLSDIERTFPSTLQNDRLIKDYAYLKATKHAFVRGELPNEYFVGIVDAGGVTGKVPKDVMLTSNLDDTFQEYETEVKRRGIEGNYIITIE